MMSHKPRVLIVDDNQDLATVVQFSLRRAGFDAHAVYSGQAALDWIARQRPDVVVLDLMMPGLNGFGLLRQLRANDTLGPVPVIVLTAHGDMENREESQSAGANDFLVKPVDTRKLVEHIQNALQRQAAANGIRHNGAHPDTPPASPA